MTSFSEYRIIHCHECLYESSRELKPPQNIVLCINNDSSSAIFYFTSELKFTYQFWVTQYTTFIFLATSSLASSQCIIYALYNTIRYNKAVKKPHNEVFHILNFIQWHKLKKSVWYRRSSLCWNLSLQIGILSTEYFLECKLSMFLKVLFHKGVFYSITYIT